MPPRPAAPMTLDAAKTKAAREEAWKRANVEAIAATNAYVDEHGLPLAEYRMF